MFGQKESNPHLYQAHLMQTAHQDRTKTRHYVTDLVNSGSVMHEYGKLFRLPTLPAHVTPQEFNEMANSTLYFNTSNDGPLFPHLHPNQDQPGPSSSNVREDLAASLDNVDDESDMDEEDVQAMFEIEAHQQHMDALDNDSELDEEEMEHYLEVVEDDPDDPDELFSDVDENASVLSASRKSQSVVPERRRAEFIASLNKFSSRINWEAEEKGLLLVFAKAKTTPSKTEISSAIRDKTGKNPQQEPCEQDL